MIRHHFKIQKYTVIGKKLIIDDKLYCCDLCGDALNIMFLYAVRYSKIREYGKLCKLLVCPYCSDTLNQADHKEKRNKELSEIQFNTLRNLYQHCDQYVI
jgi:hypothetical protein